LGYRGALESFALLAREEMVALGVTGAAPGDMLKGILSGRIPAPLSSGEEGKEVGDAFYSAILTPNGRMVTDLHVLPARPSGFLLLVPRAVEGSVREHLTKYLHPRFAQLQEPNQELSCLEVMGPDAPGMAADLLDLPESMIPGPGRVMVDYSSHYGEVAILGSRELGLPSLLLLMGRVGANGFLSRALEAGGTPLEQIDREVLRIEAGRPLFGVDMTPETIPVEAGIHREAIDYEKGCYTGQEVIIRLRDRGKVNKRLARILLGEAPPPRSGTRLVSPETGKEVGWITSSCRSPRFDQTIALGFIKRSVEGGSAVKLGGPQGPFCQVEELVI
jgi:folate-binding protein YgfZ